MAKFNLFIIYLHSKFVHNCFTIDTDSVIVAQMVTNQNKTGVVPSSLSVKLPGGDP